MDKRGEAFYIIVLAVMAALLAVLIYVSEGNDDTASLERLTQTTVSVNPEYVEGDCTSYYLTRANQTFGLNENCTARVNSQDATREEYQLHESGEVLR